MKITRDVIMDLLPLHAAGEASADTRALIDEYLKQDPELARKVGEYRLESLASAALPALMPQDDLEMRSLLRTRGMLRSQRHLYAWALALSFLPFSGIFSVDRGHVEFHLLLTDYPMVFGLIFSLAIGCWVYYFVVRRRLRTTQL